MNELKVALVNSPIVYSETGTKYNDFKCKEFVSPAISPKLCMSKIFRHLAIWCIHHWPKSQGVYYGIRSGSRWPSTRSEPPILTYLPYPFMLGYTASYLKANGISVELMDGIAAGETNCERFLERVKSASPDIVIMESFASTSETDLWFAEKVSHFAEAALAGPLIAQKAEELMNENPFVRYWLKGEYILSSLKMCQERRAGIYESEIVKDLDSIPFAYRDYPETLNYLDGRLPRPQLHMWGE